MYLPVSDTFFFLFFLFFFFNQVCLQCLSVPVFASVPGSWYLSLFSLSLSLSVSPPPTPHPSFLSSCPPVSLCHSLSPVLSIYSLYLCFSQMSVLISLGLFVSLSLFRPLPWLQPLCLCLSVTLLIPSCSPVFLVHSCEAFRVLLNRPVVMSIVSH